MINAAMLVVILVIFAGLALIAVVRLYRGPE
jgi:hypothetical protein